MKLLIFITTLIVAGSALFVEEQWSHFKIKHAKNYRNLKEEQARLKIFRDNLRKIEEHNERYQKGEVSYYMAVNTFADMTSEEYQNMLGLQISSMPQESNVTSFISDPKQPVPESIDWRDKGALTPVRDQYEFSDCGSSWAHSAAASLESHRFIHENVLEVLSVQQLVDCSRDYGNFGCDGGYMNLALDYVKEHGICAESDYKYEGKDGSCKSCKSVIKTIKEDVTVQPDEDVMKEVVGTIGPLSAAVNANPWQFYSGGVFDDECGGPVNYGILIAGYGEENGKKYWLIKGSLGIDFGEQGYIKLARGKNLCSVTYEVNYPRF